MTFYSPEQVWLISIFLEFLLEIRLSSFRFSPLDFDFLETYLLLVLR